MEWLTTQLNGENGQGIQLVLITLALAILLIVVVWIFRKVSGSAARRSMRSRVPRLSITDSTTVDDKRYLVMVRRDNVEHLLLIGGANDLVVESNIIRASAPQKPVPTSKPVETQPLQEQKVPETEITEEKAGKPDSLATPIAATAATGLAAATTVASAAKTQVKETVEAVSEVASNAIDTSAQTIDEISTSVVETASSVTDTVSSHLSDSVETIDDKIVSVEGPMADEAEIDVSDDLETELSKVVEEIEAPKIDETDLESTISAKLDDALSGDDIDIGIDAPIETVSEENNDEDTTSSDDEMKRLLDELSGENKENA